MKCFRRVAACGLPALLLSGCTMLNLGDPSERSTERALASRSNNDASRPESAGGPEAKVANPPARTIRFDGREIVLGNAEVTQIPTHQFREELSGLLEQEKYFTASLLVSKNTGAAEQAIWERYAGSTEDRLVPFIAGVLSRDVSPTISWTSLLATLESQLVDGQTYHQARATFVEKLKTEEPSDQESEQLRIVAQRLNHPLVMVDALRLIALRELVAGRHAWAESLFLQSAEMCEQHGDSARAAEFWMMAATTANRAERPAEARKAWLAAVERQLEFHRTGNHPLNVHFWIRVEDQRPTDVQWPKGTSEALLRFCAPVGCELSPESPAELVLWCAIAVVQYDSGQPQMALVNFKKAEPLASGDDVMWLRIAQSKCLAALGQSHAAAALLGGPAASDDVSIAMASTAAMGSAKLQSGAYRQGTQLINKALHESAEADWPTRSKAEADFALAQLIVGDTDEGLKALHSAQANFQSQGDIVSLLQSLENEIRILELEGRTEAVEQVQQRIREIERG